MFKKQSEQDEKPRGILTQKLRTSVPGDSVLIFSDKRRKAEDSFFIPNLLKKNASFVIEDTDGRLYQRTKDGMEQAGYRVRLLDTRHPERSDCFNPLLYLQDENVSLRDAAQSMRELFTECLMKSTRDCDCENRREPSEAEFYEEQEELLNEILLQTEEETLFAMMERMETLADKLLTRDYKEAENFAPFLKSPGDREVSQALLSRFHSFLTPETASLTGSDSLRLNRVSEEKTVLYLVPDKDRPFLTAEAFSLLLNHRNEEPGEREIPVRFFFPGPVCPNFIPGFLSLLREEDISLSFRSVEQIRSLFGGQGRTLTRNCQICLFMGTKDEKTCFFLSNAYGKEGNVRFLTADDLRAIPEGECYVFSEEPVYKGKLFPPVKAR